MYRTLVGDIASKACQLKFCFFHGGLQIFPTLHLSDEYSATRISIEDDNIKFTESIAVRVCVNNADVDAMCFWWKFISETIARQLFADRASDSVISWNARKHLESLFDG